MQCICLNTVWFKRRPDAWWRYGERSQWDGLNTAESRTVELVKPNQQIVYNLSTPKTGISPRDFVFLSTRLNLEDGSVALVQTSVDANIPSKAVRGDVQSLLWVRPNPEDPENKSIVHYAIAVDPKGWLPHFAVDMAADDVPVTIANLRDSLN
eukprot:Colp12_sorted_trinity150504_noHs@1982